MIDRETAAELMVRLTNWWNATAVWDCGMAFTVGPVFEESYEIRAAIIAGKTVSLGRARDVAHSFCDRAVLNQGLVEPNMYTMGYGGNRDDNGTPNCSCVADACSSAMALVDTINAYPDSARRGDYVVSLRKFVDYVLDTYRDVEGVIGVGILGHQINPMPKYWCANSLFIEVLIGLADITGEQSYYDTAVPILDFLARYQYEKVEWGIWDSCAPEVILYAGEGLMAGLDSDAMSQRLGVHRVTGPRYSPPDSDNGSVTGDALNRQKAEEQPASFGAEDNTLAAVLKLRMDEFIDWLHRHQEPRGTWQVPKDSRCYTAGLSWLLQWYMRRFGPSRKVEEMIARHIMHMDSPEAKTFEGLFAEAFGSALAHFSAASVVEYLSLADADEVYCSVTDASTRWASELW